jgi:hypothetical protein
LCKRILFRLTIACWVAHGGRIVILEVVVGRLWAIVVRVAVRTGGTCRVNLCGSVVPPCGVISLGTITVPGEGRVVEDPRVLDHHAAALLRVVDTPRAATRLGLSIDRYGIEETY